MRHSSVNYFCTSNNNLTTSLEVKHKQITPYVNIQLGWAFAEVWHQQMHWANSNPWSLLARCWERNSLRMLRAGRGQKWLTCRYPGRSSRTVWLFWDGPAACVSGTLCMHACKGRGVNSVCVCKERNILLCLQSHLDPTSTCVLGDPIKSGQLEASQFVPGISMHLLKESYPSAPCRHMLITCD